MIHNLILNYRLLFEKTRTVTLLQNLKKNCFDQELENRPIFLGVDGTDSVTKSCHNFLFPCEQDSFETRISLLCEQAFGLC